uniref:hypothetical protein n=1 Tax=Acinetobacter baumannii TaxID=470 RepID=UPI001C0794CD
NFTRFLVRGGGGGGWGRYALQTYFGTTKKFLYLKTTLKKMLMFFLKRLHCEKNNKDAEVIP